MSGKAQVSAPTEPVAERWTYAGVRELEGKRVHGWLTPDDRTVLYRESGAHYAIGSVYEVRVSRTGDRTTRHGDPAYTSDRANPGLVAELNAKDHAARVMLAQLARERSDAKRNELDQALEPLREIARKLNRFERDALAVTVMRAVMYP